jgi:capsular exopolysaccharide synthesis family protein
MTLIPMHSIKNTILNKSYDSNVKFRIAEAYKAARTSLTFSLVKNGCKKIVFTSSLSGEGKTTTSVNMAISLSQQLNTKVLLIDCDLRKPKVNRYFKFHTAPGLTNYLGGLKKLDEIIHKTSSPNLDVITSGLQVPNPSELLASEGMKALVNEMESNYDYIIFDTPPVNVVIDSLALADIADGFVIVVKEGSSLDSDFRHTVATLEHAKVKILGVILNGTKLEKKDSYNYHYE